MTIRCPNCEAGRFYVIWSRTRPMKYTEWVVKVKCSECCSKHRFSAYDDEYGNRGMLNQGWGMFV